MNIPTFFDFSNKEVLPVKKQNTKVKEEIQQVKGLTDRCTSGWVVLSHYCEDTIFQEDDVTYLRNVGAVTKAMLEAAGITKVSQLIFPDLSQSEIKN